MSRKHKRNPASNQPSGWRQKLNPRYQISAIRKWFKRGARRRFKWLLESAVQFMLLPFWAMWHVSQQIAWAFVYSWKNAQLRTLWYGAPFGLAVIGSIFLVMACKAAQRPAMIATEYSTAGHRAMRAKDYKAATLYYERVLKIRDGKDNSTLFSIAVAALELDNMERVDSILNILAPLDKPVYADAHILKAEMIAEKGDLTREELQQVNTHLMYTLQLDPGNVAAHALVGAYYMNTSRWQLAVDHLSVATRQRPELYLPLAKAHSFLGNTQQAKYAGQLARDHFHQLSAAQPRNIQARLNWADATMFLEEFSSAVDILREGFELHDELSFQQALARVYMTWSDSIKGQSMYDKTQRLRLLEKGVRAYTNDYGLFVRMMAMLRDDQGVAGSTRDFLVGCIARGEAIGLSHLLLGTDLGERGEIDQAIKHLEQASQLDSSMPIVANNLAWYLMQSDTIEIERAYELVSALAERWPMMAAIHDTRGQILVKMGRWEEALTDLQKALRQHRGQPATHAALVEAYENLGMSELADEHRRIIALLQP